jgi:hypothetical protein
LVIARPATVVAWHRRGFAWYWTRHSRPRGGRPHVGVDVRRVVREMAVANPLWGAPRIHGELLKMGFETGPTHGRRGRAVPHAEACHKRRAFGVVASLSRHPHCGKFHGVALFADHGSLAGESGFVN